MKVNFSYSFLSEVQRGNENNSEPLAHLSQQVKISGNLAMFMYLKGWSERQLGGGEGIIKKTVEA